MRQNNAVQVVQRFFLLVIYCARDISLGILVD